MQEYKIKMSDGCRLWAARKGHGPVVVLVHGGPGLADYLGPVQDMLAESFSVIRFDQRGCGASEGHDGPFTVDQAVQDLTEVIEHAGNGSPVRLLGHSWGANLALHAAVQHPELITALAYLNGTGIGQEWVPEWIQNREAKWDDKALKDIDALYTKKRDEAHEKALLKLLWEPDFAKRLPAAKHIRTLTERWYGIHYEANNELNHHYQNIDEVELAIACKAFDRPVLIVQGEADPRPLWCLDGLCDVLPQVHRHVMADVAHYPFLEQPEEFSQAINTFFGA